MKKDLILELKERFKSLYGRDGRVFFSPSRINIIGEHIDYNGGKVLPCAITIGTYACVLESEEIKLESLNIKGDHKTSLSHLDYDKELDFANYATGMLKFLKASGYNIGGFEAVIKGDIPNGAGLSSSASLELLIGNIINTFYNDEKIDKKTLALLGQKTENEHIGLRSGIMDQYAISLGKKGFATLIDTAEVTHEYIPLELGENCIAILNTNKRRELASSKYNERRGECEKALELLQKEFNVEHLASIEEKDLDKVRSIIKDDTIYRRAKHVITENQRVKDAIDAMEQNDLVKLGKLLNESDKSLKEDYEVTGFELDTITELARSFKTTLGSRMTGAGFGGCAIAIIPKKDFDEFSKYVIKHYKEKTGLDPEVIMAESSDGPREII